MSDSASEPDDLPPWDPPHPDAFYYQYVFQYRYAPVGGASFEGEGISISRVAKQVYGIKCKLCGEIGELPEGPGSPEAPTIGMRRFLAKHDPCEIPKKG